MLKRIWGALERALDPAGPLGEVVSPSDVYKPRAGLPITAPHAQRVTLDLPAHVEQTLAPARFVPASEALDVPRDRVRQVSAFVEERWAPVYGRSDSTDLLAIFKAAETLVGWTVTQHPCGRARRRSAEEEAEVIRSLQVQPSDEFYNGYYETIKGNDPVVLDGEILRARDGTPIRGGTHITRGRAQYRQATKGYVHWDAGFLKKREAALAEEASRPVRNVARALEAVAGEALPMHRPVGINPRRDRMRAR